jgi:HSP20 family protein
MAGELIRRDIAEMEPFRRLREWMRWDPFQEMARIFPEERLEFSPAFEVLETKDAYLFKADLPGVAEEDIDVSISGNRLTVCGKREEEKKETTDRYYAYERSYGDFTRSFTLPEGVDTDHIRSELSRGVLTLVLPKTEEAQPKKISIKTVKAARA